MSHLRHHFPNDLAPNFEPPDAVANDTPPALVGATIRARKARPTSDLFQITQRQRRHALPQSH
jgi:hypothetical protein